MATPNKNLKAVIEYLGITNLEMAKALDYDPSLISRYLTGHRVFKASSKQMDEITDYILSRTASVRDVEWLKTQFAEAGLPTDATTVFRLKQCLIMWLATDGETLRNNLGRTIPGDIAGTVPAGQRPEQTGAAEIDCDVKIGGLEIVLALRPALFALPRGATISIFLSSGRIATATNEDMSALLCELILTNELHIDMVVCVSANTRAVSKLLDGYMQPLISGHVRLSMVHGMTQTVTSSMHILLQTGYAMLVTETTGINAPPIATVIRNADFVREMQDSFDVAARYAQPILSIYDDNYSRNILEILYMEFCTPGALDVIKDSLNPLYMTTRDYDRFLQTRGHSPEEYAWRSNEFVRFKGGMDAVLQSGSPYREILSLSRLNDVAARGCCQMAGLYFMERGYIDLDAEGCLAILNGYIECLERLPNFSILILDDLDELHHNNCWHLKQNQSLGINNWQGKEPVMIHSDQLMLLREFQARYDTLWAKGAGAIGSRANVISILRDVAGRIAKQI